MPGRGARSGGLNIPYDLANPASIPVQEFEREFRPFRHHRTNNRGNALLGYLIVAVGQMEVLWPLAVSVGSPEVVSVMRPADFNSGMPFLTVFALPTLIFN